MKLSGYRRLALGVSLVAVLGFLHDSVAAGADPVMRTGTFDGQWAGDKAQFTIDKANAGGTFVGSAKLLDGANKNYVITFTGRLAKGGLISRTRTDKYPSGANKGRTIEQLSSASVAYETGEGHEWEGRTTGAGLPADRIWGFRLRLPQEVNGHTVAQVDFGGIGSTVILGGFRQTGRSSWKEFNAQHPEGLFDFKEDSRDEQSVHLSDAYRSDKSRNAKVQIDLTRKKIIYADATTPARDQYDILASYAFLELSARHGGKTMTIAKGRMFVIRLRENYTTGHGYKWKVGEISGEAVKSQGDPTYVVDREGVAGSGGAVVCTFRAVKAGKATIKLVGHELVGRDKDESPAAVRTFTVEVQEK